MIYLNIFQIIIKDNYSFTLKENDILKKIFFIFIFFYICICIIYFIYDRKNRIRIRIRIRIIRKNKRNNRDTLIEKRC